MARSEMGKCFALRLRRWGARQLFASQRITPAVTTAGSMVARGVANRIYRLVGGKRYIGERRDIALDAVQLSPVARDRR
jgi:hypothetical protein